jgi:hypothetical protein
MKQRLKNYYTEAQKALMWERWQRGDSSHAGAIRLPGRSWSKCR